MKNKIIIFDGVCNLCTSLILYVIKRDKDNIFKYAASQSEAGKKLMEQHQITIDPLNTVFLIEGDSVYTKSTAVILILKELHTFWKILYPLYYLPISFRDFIYDLIEKSRYRLFGKKEKCMVPTDDIRSRFLD